MSLKWDFSSIIVILYYSYVKFRFQNALLQIGITNITIFNTNECFLQIQ